jgi:hypothetical protein
MKWQVTVRFSGQPFTISELRGVGQLGSDRDTKASTIVPSRISN